MPGMVGGIPCYRMTKSTNIFCHGIKKKERKEPTFKLVFLTSVTVTGSRSVYILNASHNASFDFINAETSNS
jgi:hypothetical protein